MVTAEVKIELKEGIADPEGMNTEKTLKLLGWDVEKVETGKLFEIDLGNGFSEEEARNEVEEMCKKLLANPVIQTYDIEIKS
ncbi:MAG: phosphoribosylformylglycinamidine synthase subunit PurS [Candidatus Thermoplasmatota archaeon]|nr:phosphoribosylformylglycinamidine synthase subunit PurS [Candidatus Thermoplasmatota archaeon]MBS3789616.1 phosphoribosylformylglycinamidine synthase subunit PurS [Candidatus Thermoplasmatota archaeon]